MSRSAMLHIRRYRPGDHDEVWALHNLALRQVDAHAGNGPWDDDLHRIDAEYLDPGGEFLVGLAGGHLVAMGALRRRGPHTAEVKRMRVHPDFQRRGFGRAILRRLHRRAAELGIRRLHLDTTVGQVAAQRLYRAEGYRQAGRSRYGRFELLLFEKGL